MPTWTQVRNLLKTNGLEAVSLSGHSDLVSDAGIAEFRKALAIANKLGIKYVTTSTGGHDASSAGSIDDQRNSFMKNIRPLADEAAGLGSTSVWKHTAACLLPARYQRS